MTPNQPANLTWVAVNVCRIQIKCNGQKFKDERRVCGKSCRSCRTRRKTKIVTVADFPKDERSITCRCRVWGREAVRQSDIILVDKACKYWLKISLKSTYIRGLLRDGWFWLRPLATIPSLSHPLVGGLLLFDIIKNFIMSSRDLFRVSTITHRNWGRIIELF